MTPTTARTCHGCDLCCTVLDVDELAKPCGVACTHLKGRPGQSCSIYPDRPENCREFTCFWRLGLGPEKFRPSDVGFVLAIRPSSLKDQHLLTLHTDPAKPDAWRTAWALPRLQRLAASHKAAIAINQPPNREHTFIISPTGTVYDRQTSPGLFKDNKVRTPFLDAMGIKR